MFIVDFGSSKEDPAVQKVSPEKGERKKNQWKK